MHRCHVHLEVVRTRVGEDRDALSSRVHEVDVAHSALGVDLGDQLDTLGSQIGSDMVTRLVVAQQTPQGCPGTEAGEVERLAGAARADGGVAAPGEERLRLGLREPIQVDHGVPGHTAQGEGAQGHPGTVLSRLR